MGPGDSAAQSPGSSCLPGGSRVHFTRPASPETRTLLFTQLQEPRALFVGLTVGWGLWGGFTENQVYRIILVRLPGAVMAALCDDVLQPMRKGEGGSSV